MYTWLRSSLEYRVKLIVGFAICCTGDIFCLEYTSLRSSPVYWVDLTEVFLFNKKYISRLHRIEGTALSSFSILYSVDFTEILL